MAAIDICIVNDSFLQISGLGGLCLMFPYQNGNSPPGAHPDARPAPGAGGAGKRGWGEGFFIYLRISDENGNAFCI